MAQSIVAWVDATLDNARMGPIHRRVLALITAGYFFDVIDFIILGSLVPDMVQTPLRHRQASVRSAAPP